MIKYRYFLMICGLLFFTACEELGVDAPGVEITASSTTAQVGQPVTFTFNGYADMISFYSGEPGNDYAYKDGRVVDIAGSKFTLAFTSALAVAGTQVPELKLFASNDFNGDYSSLASVKAATWVDITSRFTFGTNATFVNSTAKDVTDLTAPGKPIYFAFKYVTKSQKTNGLVRNWQIQTFALTSDTKLAGANVTVTDQVNAGFRIVEAEPENAPARSTITATRVSLLGNVYKDPDDPMFDPENPIFDPKNPIYDPYSHLYDQAAVRPTFVPYDPASPWNDPELEHWAVSTAIRLDEVNLGPDWSRALKGIENAGLDEYQYTYATPGTYKAYFVVTNATMEGRKEIVKEFTITITE